LSKHECTFRFTANLPAKRKGHDGGDGNQKLTIPEIEARFKSN